MTVEDTSSNEVSLFEIKRSSEIVREQVKHFLDSEFQREFAVVYPDKVVKTYNVLYTGKTVIGHQFKDAATKINFINIHKFLCSINKWIQSLMS